MDSENFVKYFHKLTKEDVDKLIEQGITYGEMEEKYPQPLWCKYPNALRGAFGCWSLMGFLVTDEDYCKKPGLAKCPFCKEQKPQL